MKIFELLTRRRDLRRAAALHYWTATHAPLVRSRMAASSVVRRYVNNVGLDGQPPASLPFDAVVAAWLDLTPDEFARQTGAAGNPIIADEPNFLACRPLVMRVEENILRVPRESPTKLMTFLQVAPSHTRGSLVRHGADMADRMIEFWGARLTGLVINDALAGSWSSWGEEWPPFDGVIEQWLDEKPEAVCATLADRADFPCSDVTRAYHLLVSEVVQIDRS